MLYLGGVQSDYQNIALFFLLTVVLPAAVAALVPSDIWSRRARLALCWALWGVFGVLLIMEPQTDCKCCEPSFVEKLFVFAALGLLIYVVSYVAYILVRLPVQWCRRRMDKARAVVEAQPGLLLVGQEDALLRQGKPLFLGVDSYICELRREGKTPIRFHEHKPTLRDRLARRQVFDIEGEDVRGRLELQWQSFFSLELQGRGVETCRVTVPLVHKKCGVVFGRIKSFEYAGWRYNYYPLWGGLHIAGEGEPRDRELLLAAAAWLAGWHVSDSYVGFDD